MSQSTKVVVLLALLGALAYVSYVTFGPKPPAPPPVVAADDLSRCPNGVVPCPNDCLKAEKEGWRPMQVKGHPDTDLWMQFTDAKGRTVAFNQHHIGHVIQPVDGKYTDVGVCPVCKGKTRVCR